MADTETVTISYRMQQIIAHMLRNPRAAYCVSDLCRDLGLLSGSVSPIMRSMEKYGWLKSEIEPRRRYHPRTYYRFTTGTVTMLRKACAL